MSIVVIIKKGYDISQKKSEQERKIRKTKMGVKVVKRIATDKQYRLRSMRAEKEMSYERDRRPKASSMRHQLPLALTLRLGLDERKVETSRKNAEVDAGTKSSRPFLVQTPGGFVLHLLMLGLRQKRLWRWV